MNRLVYAPFIVLLASCSSGGEIYDRDGFYDRLHLALAQYNGALEGRDYQRQSSVELEITRLTTPRYDWLTKDAIEETDDDRRNLAVWGLAFVRQPQAADTLKRALDDEHPVIRGSAAFALGRQGVSDAPYEKIFAMLDDVRPHVRQSALMALKLLLKQGQDRGQLAKLLAMLDDGSYEVRNEAALVLGRLRAPASIDTICRKGLKDAHFLVRVHSAMALGGFGSDGVGALPHLVECLRDAETSVVEAAWWSLKKITGLDYDRSYHLWRDWYEQKYRRFEYYCPDHASTVRETAGFCPECGRRLEAQPKAAPKKGEAPPVLPTHVCPNHPEVTGIEGGKCAKCKADLVPK